MEAHGFTQRFGPDSSRIDELHLQLGWPLFTTNQLAEIQALGGLFYTGNLGGQQMQDISHDRFGLNSITLPYPDANKVYPALGLSASRYFNPNNQRIEKIIQTRAKLYAYWAPAYLAQLRGSLGLSFFAGSDLLALNVGYQEQEVLVSGARRWAAALESGFFMEWQTQVGLAHFKLEIFPGNNYAFGTFGVNLLQARPEKTFEKADLSLEAGAFTENMGIYLRYLFPNASFLPRFLQWEFHQHYWRINQSLNPDYPGQFGHFQQSSVGLHFKPWAAKAGWQILPNASGRLGFRTQHLYSGEKEQAKAMAFSFNALLEGGIRLKLPSGLFHKNCAYGLSANYTQIIPFYRKGFEPERTRYQGELPNQLWGLGLFVMVDW